LHLGFGHGPNSSKLLATAGVVFAAASVVVLSAQARDADPLTSRELVRRFGRCALSSNGSPPPRHKGPHYN
jgi:hypothetical protein